MRGGRRKNGRGEFAKKGDKRGRRVEVTVYYEARNKHYMTVSYTENSDYVPLSVTVGFPADPSPLVGSVICQVITIIGDDVMEEDEMFTVVMTPINDFDTIVGPLSVNITIRNDEDGNVLQV